MYSSEITNRINSTDKVEMTVKYVDGDSEIVKDYVFKNLLNIEVKIEETVEMEVNRLDGLVTAFATWKAKEGDEII